MKEWKRIKKENYKKDTCSNVYGGIINFSPESMNEFNPDDFKSYDEYLEVQYKSINNTRRYFELYYYDEDQCYFKGQIDKITPKGVLFKRIVLSGLYMDGLGFEGKEDHVWMDKTAFEDFKVGDCLSFNAEIYRYLKKGNGKMIDFGLRNPSEIELIEKYEIPTDEELIDQQIDQLLCEVCLFKHQCYMGMCIANERDYEDKKAFLKKIQPGKFTIFTVMAAYEMSGRVVSQLTGGKVDKKDPNYKIMNKIINEAGRRNAGCIWPVEKAIINMLYPDKPRLYIE